MTLREIAVRSFAVGSLFLSASAFGQSSNADNSEADELNWAASQPGVCHDVPSLKPPAPLYDRIAPGKYLFYSSGEYAFDVELVGGGGGGGGSTINSKSRGGGGASGELKRSVGLNLQRGAYLLEVGRGGASVQGGSKDGGAGHETAIKRCSSQFRVVFAKGGSGGTRDGVAGAPRGGDLIDPETGETIGVGGRTGGYQESGIGGGGWGSGGGGEGEHTEPTSSSGAGAAGYARLVRLKR